VLFIAPTSFFADYGCHVRILQQARAAQALGHEVLLCTYHSGRDWPGLAIRRTPPIPWRRGLEVGSSWHKLAYDVLLAPVCLQAVRQFRPHLIHAFLHEGALLGWMLRACTGLPLAFDFQGSLTSEMVDHGFLSPRSPFFRPLRWLEAFLDRQADLLLANSGHAADLLVRAFGVARERIALVPDGADVAHFRPPGPEDAPARAALRHRLGLPESGPLIAYLGLLAPYQGTDLLLQAVRHFLDGGGRAHVLIMGFPHLDRYRAQAEALGLASAVTFTGAIPYEEAPRYLHLADLAVAPKISATEGSGKLLAYMAAGLPVVAFDTPVHREVLGDLGLYAPAGDARALAARMAEALEDREAARARGMALRARAERLFGPDAVAQSLAAAYSRALDRGR